MKKNIVIVLLVIAVLGLGGFVVYDKVLKKDEFKKEEKINDVQDVDLMYKNYINNLIKIRNDLGKHSKQTFFGNSYHFAEGYAFYVETDGELNFTLFDYEDNGENEVEHEYQNYKIASNVVTAFLVGTGQDEGQTLYYITEDGNLYDLFVQDFVMTNKLNIKKLENKNIVNIIPGLFSDGYSGGYGPIFVDIEGNQVDQSEIYNTEN